MDPPTPSLPQYGTNPPLLESYNRSSYVELVQITSTVLRDVYKHRSHMVTTDLATLWYNNPNLWPDVALCLLSALVLTVVRLKLGNAFMNNVMLKHKLVKPKNTSRFMESFYVHVFSTLAFTFAFLIERQYGFLAHSERLWEGWSLADQSIPTAIWAIYIFELSHYIHSVYAVVYINPWNDMDSIAMLFHHVFAILLLGISYLTKTHRVGILVMYLHDICDVIMEGTKCLIKLELTSAWAIKTVEAIKVACFGALLFFWFYFRLYLFPLRVIYPGVLYSTTNPPETWFPLSLTLFALLWLVFALNVYWAVLLLKVLVKTILEGAGEIEDPRDVEEVAAREQLKKAKSKVKSKKAD